MDVIWSFYGFVLGRSSLWSPIRRALSDFNGNLSSGIAGTLTGLAYLLPWSLILALIWWLARKLWRRRGKTVSR